MGSFTGTLLGSATMIEPPSGIAPDLESPPSNAYVFIDMSIIMLVITTALLTLRLFTRVYIAKKCELEDCKY